jgi:glycosyltransferase involved in cell wall biosynthesis
MRHLPRREARHNLEILRPESFRRREDTCTVAEMGLYIVTNLPTVLNQAWRWHPDVIHAHFAVPTGPLALAARTFTGIPYVLTAHLGDVPGGVPEQTAHLFRLLGPFVAPVWRGAQAVTVVSGFVADLASRAYRVRPIVIPNGVDPVAPLDIAVHSPCRLSWLDVEHSEESTARDRSSGNAQEMDWSLDVIGDGPVLEMRASAQREGVDGRVRLHGWLSAVEVAQVVARSDIL